MQNRAEAVDQAFLRRVADGDFPSSTTGLTRADSDLTDAALVEIFDSQILSRQLDLTSRRMQAKGQSFYTIGSSGHEGNAAISAVFRHTDMAFLHYRDAPFLIQRSRQLPGQTPAWDLLLSFAASEEDPISGGRHKVLGSKALFIPPQTSTIASHLPKALGAAYSLGLSRRTAHKGAMPDDSVVLCSFGDASFNHSTAQGAINAAAWTAYQNIPLPLVWVCEDNGIGISTNTPKNWISANAKNKPATHYVYGDGLDLIDTLRAAKQAETYARAYRQPVFLHIRTVRMMGHAGSDAQTTYMSINRIEETEAQDPLLHTARILVESGILTQDEVLARYIETGQRLERIAVNAATRPKLSSAQAVMASIIPPTKAVNTISAPTADERSVAFGRELKQQDTPQHCARLLNWALTDLMLQYREIVMAGEDIGTKGGVYNVTQQLSNRFGQHRVINTLLDEQSILGLAMGLAHNNFLPMPEIQFLAYVHNAEDQIRGEAATLSFFSNGQYTNPMVIRIAGLGYQKGFGGHFHNDNSIAVFRDIPGIIVVCPSNGHDGVLLLREAVRLAREEQRVVVFLEPIALYMTRDLHAEGDGLWTHQYPGIEAKATQGRVSAYGDGTDLTIVSYGNGYYLSRQAAALLAEQGIHIRVVDLQWLCPLPEVSLIATVKDSHRILIVDECRKSGSISEALMSLFHETLPQVQVARIAAEDSFIPLGISATATMPSRDSIVAAALALYQQGAH
jgi:2-oxoisovalerate dehydrogenase E1 component